MTTAWPRQPFIGMAIAAVVGVFVADWFTYPAVGLLLMLSAGVVALRRRSSVATYCFVAAALFSLHSLRQDQSAGRRFAKELGDQPVALAAGGMVSSEPKVSARGMASFHFRLQWTERDGVRKPSNATLLARYRGDVQYGDELQLFGSAYPIEGPRNPGEFDMRAYLARREIHHSLVVRYPENGKLLSRGGGNRILKAARASRDWMQNALSRGLEDSPEHHGLISSMVLGLREDTPDEVEEQFQQTGTIHLFSVSGLHVGIIAYLLWTIANILRIPRKWAVALIIPSLFFYAAITGLNTASLRAATMAAVLLGGTFVDRKVLSGNSVAAAAVLILAFETNQLFSIGFQLSFAVVATIILLAEPLYRLLMRFGQPDPFLPPTLFSSAQKLWLSAWGTIARGASVSLAAWIGSLPLILPYFYLVTPVALFANLAIVPLAFFVLAIGVMSLLVTAVTPWLALVFNNANWTLSAAILAAVDLFAHAPAGHLYMERPHWPDGTRAEITALDVGPGAAVHVRTRQSDWLFDAGAARDFRRVVRGYLRSRGINRLDALVLTHGDSQHIGAATAMLQPFQPREIIDTAAPDGSSIHRDLIAHLQDRQIDRRFAAAPEDLRLSKDVSARVLFPPPGFRASKADDQALVVQLNVSDRWRVLLMSDAGEATEQHLLASGEDLRSDIIIKGQHSTGRSALPAFLDRVQPDVIVASSSPFPGKDRINEDWAASVTARGIKLFRQDHAGAVTVRFFRARWEATAYVGSDTFRSNSR
jgi:ComEC/Rec2-related protein